MGQCNRVLVSWMAHCVVTHPDKCSFTPSNDAERAWFAQEHRRITLALARREQVQSSYDLSAPAKVATPALATVVPIAPRREARSRERRAQSARSSARSGDSGSDEPGESDPAADWHWRQPDSWVGLIASVRSRDFERELHLERWSGRRA